MANNGGIDSAEFFGALDLLSKERRINKDVLYTAIESALISAYKKSFGKTIFTVFAYGQYILCMS